MAVLRNRICLALPPEDRQQLLLLCHPVQFPSGHVIYRTADEIKDVYFIDSGLVCLLKRMEDGRSGEISVVGSGPSAAEYVVQVPVAPHCIGLAALQREMSIRVALRNRMSRFLSLLTGQFAQVSACNRLHSLEQRCASWLLIARDNVFSDKFQLTHEFIASLLGVQRPSVSMTANGLQKRGLFRYSHGHVSVLDRLALEFTACECYQVRRRQIDQTFRDP